MAEGHVLCLPRIYSTMKKQTTGSRTDALALTACAAAVLLLIRYGGPAKTAVTDALSLCGSVIIPSLFPMLILSRFAAACRLPSVLRNCCAGPLRMLLGLSPDCLTPLLLGLTCGYPMAAKAADAAKKEGLIAEGEARRIMLCFTCPGIPFSVAVAGEVFRSRALGWTLLASCAAADLLSAVCCRILRKNASGPPACPPAKPKTPTAEKLVHSVDGAAGSVLSVCAWICAFSAFTGVWQAAAGGLGEPFFSLAAEVTGALRTAAGLRDLPLTAACLAFGGVCVFCQLLPTLKENGAGAARYLAVRLLCAGFAYLNETALLRLLPLTVPTETRLGAFYLSANSVAGSAALLFLCAVFMAETSRERDRI